MVKNGPLKRLHMAAHKRVQVVVDVRGLRRIGKLFDEIDSHYKVLLVLRVPAEHYSVAIVPDLMSKIPRDIALDIKR